MGKCKFLDKWLTDDKYKIWVAKDVDDERSVHCKLCKNKFKLGIMGFKALDSQYF